MDNSQRIAWRNSVNTADTFVIDMSGDTAFLRAAARLLCGLIIPRATP